MRMRKWVRFVSEMWASCSQQATKGWVHIVGFFRGWSHVCASVVYQLEQNFWKIWAFSGHNIEYLFMEFGWARHENIWLSEMTSLSWQSDLKPNIFLCGPPTMSNFSLYRVMKKCLYFTKFVQIVIIIFKRVGFWK